MVLHASINSPSCLQIAFAVMPAQAGIQMGN
jgi:hypothetical protein